MILSCCSCSLILGSFKEYYGSIKSLWEAVIKGKSNATSALLILLCVLSYSEERKSVWTHKQRLQDFLGPAERDGGGEKKEKRRMALTLFIDCSESSTFEHKNTCMYACTHARTHARTHTRTHTLASELQRISSAENKRTGRSVANKPTENTDFKTGNGMLIAASVITMMTIMMTCRLQWLLWGDRNQYNYALLSLGVLSFMLSLQTLITHIITMTSSSLYSTCLLLLFFVSQFEAPDCRFYFLCLLCISSNPSNTQNGNYTYILFY